MSVSKFIIDNVPASELAALVSKRQMLAGELHGRPGQEFTSQHGDIILEIGRRLIVIRPTTDPERPGEFDQAWEAGGPVKTVPSQQGGDL